MNEMCERMLIHERSDGGIRGYDPMDMCWEELAHAVILSAVNEYRRALKCLQINPRNDEWNQRKTECEQFFWSWWFGILTDADPETVMDKLKKEAAEWTQKHTCPGHTAWSCR